MLSLAVFSACRRQAVLCAAHRAQERAGELQVFVEVLLGCADDPREAEGRRPEAALRAQVERLRAKLDGPERQAELAAARQQQVRARAAAAPRRGLEARYCWAWDPVPDRSVSVADTARVSHKKPHRVYHSKPAGCPGCLSLRDSPV